MRAVICRQYGPPEVALRSEDVEKPAPGDDEVLIRVRAAAVNPLDWHLMKGRPFGFRLLTGLTRPSEMRPGRDVAGQVEAVGRNVVQFDPGDEVFGVGRGAFAEYACAHQAKLALKPAAVTFAHAASAPIAGITALQALRDKGQLQAGQRVLINGAAGGVGMFAVQLARSMGAEVTGVCSTRNVDMLRRLGADHVIDYTREDFTRLDARYDLMLDSIRNHSLTATRRVLTRHGRLIVIGIPPGRWFVSFLGGLVKPLLVAPFVSQKLTFLAAKIRSVDLALLGELMASETLTPIVDQREGLGAVPHAIREVATRHARGKVVIVL
jgi:NADPH:quinone reductase-like Zn-dependent oxidoreductase